MQQASLQVSIVRGDHSRGNVIAKFIDGWLPSDKEADASDINLGRDRVVGDEQVAFSKFAVSRLKSTGNGSAVRRRQYNAVVRDVECLRKFTITAQALPNTCRSGIEL